MPIAHIAMVYIASVWYTYRYAYRTYRYAYRTYRYAYPVQASAIMHLVMSYSCRIHAPGYVVFGGCGGHLSMRGKVSDTHVDVGDT